MLLIHPARVRHGAVFGVKLFVGAVALGESPAREDSDSVGSAVVGVYPRVVADSLFAPRDHLVFWESEVDGVGVFVVVRPIVLDANDFR